MPQRIVLPLDVEISAKDTFTWPEVFEGVSVHGLLTSALNFRVCGCLGRTGAIAHHPACPAADLLNTAKGGGRRFAIGPVRRDEKTLRFRLFLYGPAARSYDRLADALDALVYHGIGEGRGAVASCAMARGDRVFYHTAERILSFPGEPDTVAAPWLVSTLDASSAFNLDLVTPLDLSWKRCPEDPKQAVSLGGIARAFVNRWAALDDGARPVPAHAVRRQAEAWCLAIAAIKGRLVKARWFETIRHSARQHRNMVFSGLVGTLQARTGSRELASLAAALEFMPVGGRTAFGFGSVRLRRGARS